MSESPSTLTFLLWNINGRDCTGLIAELVRERNVDIAVLLEAGEGERQGFDESPLIESVIDSTGFYSTSALAGRSSILTRTRHFGLREIYCDRIRRFTLRTLHCFDHQFLLGAVHLPCKLHWSNADQAAQAIPVATRLRELEEEQGNPGTLLMGDFNMNPFEAGMVQAMGFHAMMSSDTVMAESRAIQQVDYPFFYNPMWGMFGDRTPGPPGTFFQRRSAPI